MSREGNAQLLSSSDFIKKLPCLENIFQQDVKSQKIFLMCDSVIVFFQCLEFIYTLRRMFA